MKLRCSPVIIRMDQTGEAFRRREMVSVKVTCGSVHRNVAISAALAGLSIGLCGERQDTHDATKREQALGAFTVCSGTCC